MEVLLANPKVLVLGSVPKPWLADVSQIASVEEEPVELSLSADEMIGKLKGVDVLMPTLVPQISAKVIESCPQLKMVANIAVGYDKVDIVAATKAGVLVTNTPGVLDETCADFAFGLMLASARRIAEADRFIRSGQFEGWKSQLLLGQDIYKKTIGIIGFGRIGQAVARRAAGFGMRILYLAHRKGMTQTDLPAEPVDLDTLLRQSDFISLHCPLNKETHHLIGESQFAKLKPNCILINTARGAVIDEKALVKALEAKQLAGCGLDVFENEPAITAELLQMENVVLAPHVASATMETRAKMTQLASDSVIQALAGTLPKTAVNPEVWPTFLKRLS